MESRDAYNKKQEFRKNKLSTQEQPCKHCHQAEQTYFQKDINEKKIHEPEQEGHQSTMGYQETQEAYI